MTFHRAVGAHRTLVYWEPTYLSEPANYGGLYSACSLFTACQFAVQLQRSASHMWSAVRLQGCQACARDAVAFRASERRMPDVRVAYELTSTPRLTTKVQQVAAS
jgi:hypothetical protein